MSHRGKETITRRRLLSVLGLSGVGVATAGIAGGLPRSSERIAQSHMMGGHTALAATTAAAAPATDLDAMHEAAVKAFPAKTEGLGGQPLAPKVEGGVKVFDLTTKVVQWEVKPGQRFEAFSYNGVVPGPLIRVTEGDKVRVRLKNELPESTSIHWHGLFVPNNMDGVPYITQPPVKPGQSFVYEFVARNPGSHMYHSHHAADIQVPKGLLGAFIIDPKNRSRNHGSPRTSS